MGLAALAVKGNQKFLKWVLMLLLLMCSQY